MTGPGTTPGSSLFPLAGCKLEITVEGGYLKAYASPDDGAGIISYGLEGRVANGSVLDAARDLVAEYLEAQRV